MAAIYIPIYEATMAVYQAELHISRFANMNTSIYQMLLLSAYHASPSHSLFNLS